MQQSNIRIIRYLWFSVSILIGVLIGFYLGWVVKPVKYADMGLDQLREDYQVDYVLMVAEAYQSDGDIQSAKIQLSHLNEDLTPVRITQEAIIEGRKFQFSPGDLELMVLLSQDLLNETVEGQDK